MARVSCFVLLAIILLPLVSGYGKAEDEPVEYDRTAVLAKLDAAVAKAVDRKVKIALKKMRECAERGDTKLDLRGNQLTTLPPEIGQLTNLTRLYLRPTQLTTLPPEIGQLTKLTTLALHGNKFTKLPPEIGKLTNLTTLALRGTKLTTLPPEIGKLTKLTKLSLRDNPMTDAGLEHLKSLKSLKFLHVRDTKVTKAGVDALKKSLPNCIIGSDF